MSVDRRRLDWLSTEGGPLLLIGKSDLSSWGGVLRSELRADTVITSDLGLPDLDGTDYDRACEIDDPIALIKVGSIECLLVNTLSDEVVVHVGADRQGCSIIRKIRHGDEETTANYIRNERLLSNAAKEFEVKLEGPVYLIDATIPGDRIPEFEDFLVVDVASGIYSVAAATETPDCWTELFFIDLIRQN